MRALPQLGCNVVYDEKFKGKEVEGCIVCEPGMIQTPLTYHHLPATRASQKANTTSTCN
jgi:hypothetical protein